MYIHHDLNSCLFGQIFEDGMLWEVDVLNCVFLAIETADRNFDEKILHPGEEIINFWIFFLSNFIECIPKTLSPFYFFMQFYIWVFFIFSSNGLSFQITAIVLNFFNDGHNVQNHDQLPIKTLPFFSFIINNLIDSLPKEFLQSHPAVIFI